MNTYRINLWNGFLIFLTLFTFACSTMPSTTEPIASVEIMGDRAKELTKEEPLRFLKLIPLRLKALLSREWLLIYPGRFERVEAIDRRLPEPQFNQFIFESRHTFHILAGIYKHILIAAWVIAFVAIITRMIKMAKRDLSSFGWAIRHNAVFFMPLGLIAFTLLAVSIAFGAPRFLRGDFQW